MLLDHHAYAILQCTEEFRIKTILGIFYLVKRPSALQRPRHFNSFDSKRPVSRHRTYGRNSAVLASILSLRYTMYNVLHP